MKQVLTILCFFASASLLMGQGKALPSATIKTLEGQNINVQELGESGKITVLSFWATWCSPCKKELDAIMDYYEEWQEEYDMELDCD
ncbi:MAG: TlpA disulfide reductase family protein [Saprospiraceae bacterium]